MKIKCGYEWRDGWGRHKCSRPVDHGGTKHRCKCDATIYEEKS